MQARELPAGDPNERHAFKIVNLIYEELKSTVSAQFLIENDFFLFYLSGKLFPCACTYPWCTTLREKHLFSNSMVQFPSNEGEREVWLVLLGTPTISSTSRVSIIHFFEVDFLVSSTGSGLCQFDTIDRNCVTKYQVEDTGNSSLIAPSRPACPKSAIEESVFFNVRQLLHSDYMMHQSVWLKVKKSKVLKRKESKESFSIYAEASDSQKSTPSSSFLKFIDPDSENLRAGRVPDTPYNENFMGTSLKLVSLIKAIHHHAKGCTGSIVIRRNNIVQKRLSLQVTINCTKNKSCATWTGGSYKWVSANKIFYPNSSRPALVPDVLYSMASI